MSCSDTASIVGRRSLFLGVDTQDWTLDQFKQAAQFARAHHIDTLFVKVADGGNRWYQWAGDNLVGWQQIKQAIHQQYIGAIPYTYSYGNTYGALGREIALLQEYMKDGGVVIADMEQEWNGHADWAATLCTAMKPLQGAFLVSTWANPYDQNWQSVIRALNPCVDSYLPQQYTNYLASCWAQFGALGAACIMPTVMIGQDFGPNDPAAIAKAAHAQGHAAMSIWYYDTAIQNPGLLDQIVAAFPVSTQPTRKPAPTPTIKDTKYMDKQFTDVWNSNALGQVATSGIAQYAHKAFIAGALPAVFPTSREIKTADWSGNAIIYQTFSNGYHAEYRDGQCAIYDGSHNHKVY